MKKQGYDRRACKDVAPVIVKYLQHQSEQQEESQLKPQEGEWISVKDRLPIKGSYLCFMENCYVKMCQFESAEWLDMWEHTLKGEVAYWQLLPIPPKG